MKKYFLQAAIVDGCIQQVLKRPGSKKEPEPELIQMNEPEKRAPKVDINIAQAINYNSDDEGENVDVNIEKKEEMD